MSRTDSFLFLQLLRSSRLKKRCCVFRRGRLRLADLLVSLTRVDWFVCLAPCWVLSWYLSGMICGGWVVCMSCLGLSVKAYWLLGCHEFRMLMSLLADLSDVISGSCLDSTGLSYLVSSWYDSLADCLSGICLLTDDLMSISLFDSFKSSLLAAIGYRIRIKGSTSGLNCLICNVLCRLLVLIFFESCLFDVNGVNSILGEWILKSWGRIAILRGTWLLEWFDFRETMLLFIPEVSLLVDTLFWDLWWADLGLVDRVVRKSWEL